MKREKKTADNSMRLQWRLRFCSLTFVIYFTWQLKKWFDRVVVE